MTIDLRALMVQWPPAERAVFVCWLQLLEAALAEPDPSPRLKRAINALLAEQEEA